MTPPPTRAMTAEKWELTHRDEQDQTDCCRLKVGDTTCAIPSDDACSIAEWCMEQRDLEVASLTQRLAEMQEQAANASDAIAEHCAKFGDAEFQGTDTAQSIRVLSQRLAEMQAERDKARADWQMLLDDSNDLERQLDTLKQNANRRIGQLEGELTAERSVLRAEIERLNAEHDRCVSEGSFLHAAIVAKIAIQLRNATSEEPR